MNSKATEHQQQLAHVLLNRLEKISSDSSWAHQASGIRAAIAKKISRSGLSLKSSGRQDLEKLLKIGFEILEKAAGEIPDNSTS
ncbi:MAG: hypothetical protein KAS84_00675 [Anaerolineales bacterium]|nr:hypothetical protein [Anaerolineales bacterium]